MLSLQTYQPEHAVTFSFENGEVMVNATEMAKPFGKQPKDFLRTQSTQEYIMAFSGRTKCLPTDLVRVVNGGNSYGTWLHRKLALRFAQWLSPDFAIWVDEKIEELLTTGKTKIFPTMPTTYKDALLHLLQQVEANEVLATENAKLQPKAAFYDVVTMTNETFTFSEAAKVLNIPGIGQKKLFAFLRENGVLMRNNEPYQRYVDSGWFRCVEGLYTDKYNVDHVYRKTVIFQKGLDGILKMMKNAGLAKTNHSAF